MVVAFADVAKAPKDLFKKPFNAGKTDIDIKSGIFTLKNSVAGDKLKSELEFKAEDALLGLGKGFTLPVTKKYDGKAVKLEFKKAFDSNGNKLNVDINTNIVPESGKINKCHSILTCVGAYSHSLKTKITGANFVAGIDMSVDNPAAASFHACTAIKGNTVGISGSLADPSALNYVYSPCGGLFFETNLKNHTLHLYKKSGDTAVATRVGFACGSAESSFALAVKKSLASGADLSIKADQSGSIDVAHVSNLSEGVKMTLGANFNSLNLAAAPKFGAGFEFNF